MTGGRHASVWTTWAGRAACGAPWWANVRHTGRDGKGSVKKKKKKKTKRGVVRMTKLTRKANV